MFAQLRTSAQRARDTHRFLIDHQSLVPLRCIDYGQDVGPHYANQVHARQSFKLFALCRSSARHPDTRFLKDVFRSRNFSGIITVPPHFRSVLRYGCEGA